MLRPLPMLRTTRWPALLVCSLLLAGCPSTTTRCRPGYRPVQLDPLVCALPDGGDAPDVADVPPVMCGPDGGPSMANDPLDDGMDQNCDGVDGELSQTVFVAESGVDSPGRGRDPSMPVRSTVESRSTPVSATLARKPMTSAPSPSRWSQPSFD